MPLLGKNYWPMMEQIRGRSSDQLSFSSTRKSISHAETFSRDLYTIEELSEQISRIARALSFRMQKASKKGKQLSLTLRDRDFHNQVRSIGLQGYTNQFEPIFEAARALLIENYEPVGYRLLGITIGSLMDEDQIILQPTLFENTQTKTEAIIEKLNQSARNEGLNATLMSAGDLLRKKAAQKERTEAEEKTEDKTHESS